MNLLAGIHAVREALNAGQPLERVHIVKNATGARLQEIASLCRRGGIAIRFETREALDRLCNGAPHQGVVAVPSRCASVGLEEVLETARMLVLLDGVEDPHNLGAVIRTAHAAGASAVVIPERRSAPLSEAAAKAAAGALAYLPVVRVTNLNRSIETLQEKGFWIYGLDERGEHAYDQVPFRERCALVLGAEGKGLHEQVRKHCDYLVRIPLSGRISSLNVSVAAGIALFEWKRRSGDKPPSGLQQG